MSSPRKLGNDKFTDFNSSTRVTVYAVYINVFY